MTTMMIKLSICSNILLVFLSTCPTLLTAAVVEGAVEMVQQPPAQPPQQQAVVVELADVQKGTISLQHRFGSARTPYCLDIEGNLEEDTLDCRFVTSRPCRGNADQMFVYSVEDRMIYSPTLMGGTITQYYGYLGDGTIHLSDFDEYDRYCGRNVTAQNNGPEQQAEGKAEGEATIRGGCLSLVGKFVEGARFGISYCLPGEIYQVFELDPSTGRILIPIPNNSEDNEEQQYLCLGMTLNLYPGESSGEFSRVLEAMDCDTADPRSITWIIDPMPSSADSDEEDLDIIVEDMAMGGLPNNVTNATYNYNFNETIISLVEDEEDEEDNIPEKESSVEIINRAGGGTYDVAVAEKENEWEKQQGTPADNIDEPLPELLFQSTSSGETATAITATAASALLFFFATVFLFV